MHMEKRRSSVLRVSNFHDVDMFSFEDGDDCDAELEHDDVPATPSSPNEKASKNWAKLRTGVQLSAAMQNIAKRRRRVAITWAATSTVIAGCVTCVPFELLNKADRGCSELILFAQYLYASAEATMAGNVREFLFDRKMPLYCHLSTLVFEQARNRLYNAALDMNLPMPAYLVLKNSGLVVSMCMGFTIQGKSYGKWQVAGVFVITIGVIMATFAARPATKTETPEEATVDSNFPFALLLMICGVLVTALMNVVQEAGFNKYGKHFHESIFYANVLGLPVFFLSGSALASHAATWTKTWYALPLPEPFNVSIPHLWLLLFLNIAAQSLMKISCLKLTALAGSVPNVVTVTVFRFLSLALSASWLNSPPFPPLTFWLGGIMILGGTLAYALLGPTQIATDKKQG